MSNDTKIIEGDDAERAALEAERNAARASATREKPDQALAREIAERLRSFGAEGISAESAIDGGGNGGEPPSNADTSATPDEDPLDTLAERAKADPSVAFLPSALEALLSLKEDEPFAFQQLWMQLKRETKIPMTALREQLDELARDAKRQAKQREKEQLRAAAMDRVQAKRDAREERRAEAKRVADEIRAAHFYTSDDERLEMRPGEIITLNRRGDEETVAHYSARIAAEVHHDTGARDVRMYEMEVVSGRDIRRFDIKAEDFGSMKWTALAGADVVTAAGPKARDLARECIQLASRPIPKRHEYGFTGWRTIDGSPAYLHAGGAITDEAPRESIVVKLPEGAHKLKYFKLPAPLEGDDLKRGIQQCLQLMFALPDFTGPLCAAAWRAVLGDNRNVLFVVGGQKNGKTTAMLWAQNHFATKFTTADVPLTWDSTAFGVRAALATIGDAVLLVDDYRPLQDPKHEPVFVAIVRNVSDGTSRSKGTIDSTVVQDPTPRALLFASGETRPKIDSVNSRLVVLPLGGRLPLESEDVAQFNEWAREGRFAGTMAAYITWLADGDRLAKIRHTFAAESEQFATELQAITREGRSAKAVASLWAGVLPFLRWAAKTGAITIDEGREAAEAIGQMFRELAHKQIDEQQSEDASARFIDYLRSALRSGQAHLTTSKRQAPDEPGRWGWQIADSGQEDRVATSSTGQTYEVRAKWVARGRCIGVLRAEHAYIDRKAALGLVQKMCAEAKENFTVDAVGLTEQLLRRGFLAKVEGPADSPKSRTVRAWVASTTTGSEMVQRSGYLCMRAALLSDEIAEDPTPEHDGGADLEAASGR